MNAQSNTKNELNAMGITFLAGSGALEELPRELLGRGVRRVFLLADENTHAAAGKRVEELLKKASIKASRYVFSAPHLEPNEGAVGLAFMHFDPSADAVVGVGSGVINDISKIVAHASGKPYIIVVQGRPAFPSHRVSRRNEVPGL